MIDFSPRSIEDDLDVVVVGQGVVAAPGLHQLADDPPPYSDQVQKLVEFSSQTSAINTDLTLRGVRKLTPIV